MPRDFNQYIKNHEETSETSLALTPEEVKTIRHGKYKAVGNGFIFGSIFSACVTLSCYVLYLAQHTDSDAGKRDEIIYGIILFLMMSFWPLYAYNHPREFFNGTENKEKELAFALAKKTFLHINPTEEQIALFYAFMETNAFGDINTLIEFIRLKPDQELIQSVLMHKPSEANIKLFLLATNDPLRFRMQCHKVREDLTKVKEMIKSGQERKKVSETEANIAQDGINDQLVKTNDDHSTNNKCRCWSNFFQIFNRKKPDMQKQPTADYIL